METGRSTVPLNYYQGVTSDPAGNLYFDGIYFGLYRTTSELVETGRNDDVIPPAVHATEGYNHIGDIAWDAREGGRILLPLECYYPYSAPGTEDPGNPCGHGSIGVADPATLRWRYYVKLDAADIPKVMWNEVSPDGRLLWSQDRKDLVAYDVDQISPANAAPAGPALKPVRRLPGAVPPPGITGAVFLDGRLYTAGQDGTTFQVWSTDLTTGDQRLEIERTEIRGESEGLDDFAALGGTLHWLIQPYNTEGPPTYGMTYGTLLHFVPKGGPPAATPPARPARIRVKVRPRRVRAGRRVRLRVTTSALVGGRVSRVAATVRVLRRSARSRSGRVWIRVRPSRRGRLVVRATAPGLRAGRAVVRVTR